MKALHYPVVLILALFQLSCQSQPAATVDFAAISDVIDSRTQQFTEAHVSGDQAFVDSIFTADARVYAPNSDVIVGRSEISRINAEYLSYGISQFREESTSRYGNEDLIVDEGTYVMTYGPDNTTEEGHYLNIWKRVGNDWKIQANMWTTLPSPAVSE